MEREYTDSNQTLAMLQSFREIHMIFAKWSREVILKNKLSLPQFRILQAMHLGIIIPQKTLGEKTNFSKSTLSANVEGLVSAGLIKRIFSEENRREVQLLLTEEGEQKVRQINEDPDGVLQRMKHVLEQIPQEKINALLEIHHQIYELSIEGTTINHGGKKVD